ncbi:MAG: endolytic transglycosylase MltG [bacterium]|jgi:UPF0755 protein
MAAFSPIQLAKRYLLHIVMGIFAALVLLIIGINNLLAPVTVGSTGTPVRVVIPGGATGGAIAQILADEGLIKNELLFRVLVRWEGAEEKLQAGEYELSPAMAPREIIHRLVQGDTVKDYVRVTIPEGYTVLQIADLLAQEGVVEKARFLDLVQEGVFAFDFISDIPDTVDYRLDGYLFPDTYYFSPELGEEAVINLMLQRFAEVVTPEIRERAQELGMSLHDLITLASIVEREARLPEERPVIAGVFHKRLQLGRKLESCATIQYILGEPKERLLTEDTRIPSPYNTYLHAGLPPGPIAASGEDSIRAAAYPEDTEYLYFCATGDGSHIFSRTLAEHNQAKKQTQR